MKNVDIRTISNAYQHILMIIICIFLMTLCGILLLVCFPGGSVVKNLLANAGDTGLNPGLGRFPRGGNGNPLQYSSWEKSMELQIIGRD